MIDKNTRRITDKLIKQAKQIETQTRLIELLRVKLCRAESKIKKMEQANGQR